MTDLEKRLKNINLEEIENNKNSEKNQKSSFLLNISNLEQNTKAKESAIYYVLNKVKLQNELQDNFKLSIDNNKRPYNLGFTKDYVYLPFGECSFVLVLAGLMYKNKITLNSFGAISCFFAVANEMARNYLFQKNFKKEYDLLKETQRNYSKIINSCKMDMSLSSVLEHYLKNQNNNFRDKQILSILRPQREKYFEKETFNELMFALKMLTK